MEIFKLNIKFTAWGEIYLGLKKEWIKPNDVILFCESNKIKKCNEKRMIQLILDLEDSLFSFYKCIKEFVIEDGDIPIIKNEDESEYNFDYIPLVYWDIWELEFLLKIDNMKLSIKKTLEEIACLFDSFGYPEEWKPFLYYQPLPEGNWLSDNELYDNFHNYLNNKKNALKTI